MDFWSAQDGACAACRREDRPLCQDHDHSNGLCRGRLCTPCNTGMGQFGDDPAQLRAAAAYLDVWQRAHAEEPSRWPPYRQPPKDVELNRRAQAARRAAQQQREAEEKHRRARDQKRERLLLAAGGIRWALDNWRLLGGKDARGRLRAAIREMERQAGETQETIWRGPTSDPAFT